MTQQQPDPPRRTDLTPGKLFLRTALGVILLVIGVYTLTRRTQQESSSTPSTTSPSAPQEWSRLPDATPEFPSAPYESPGTPSERTPRPKQPRPPAPSTTTAPYVPGDATIVGPTTAPTPAAPDQPEANITAMAFAQDTRLMVARAGAINLHDLSSGSRIPIDLQATGVTEMRASPAGDSIAIAGGDREPVAIYSIVPKSTRKLAHAGSAVCFSPDSRTLATADAAGELRLWDAISWNVTATLRPGVGAIHSIAFSTDGRSIALAGQGVAIWELPGNRPRTTIAAGANCPSVAFSPDAHTIATADERGVTLWETVFWQKLATLSTAQPVTRLSYWRGGTTIVMSLADGSIELWDVTARRRTAAFPTKGPLVSFALSPDDRTLAAATASAVTLWDTLTRNPRPLP